MVVTRLVAAMDIGNRLRPSFAGEGVQSRCTADKIAHFTTYMHRCWQSSLFRHGVVMKSISPAGWYEDLDDAISCWDFTHQTKKEHESFIPIGRGYAMLPVGMDRPGTRPSFLAARRVRRETPFDSNT